MTRKFILPLVVIAVLGLVAAACGGDDATLVATPAATPTPTAPVGPTVTGTPTPTPCPFVILGSCEEIATATPIPTSTPTPPTATLTPTTTAVPSATTTPTLTTLTPTPTPTATPQPLLRPTVTFGTEMISVDSDERFDVPLIVHPLGNGISAAEIRLTFDPGSFELVSMTPGTLLGADPLVVIQSINDQTGEAQFVMARKGATAVPTATGTLLILRWRTLQGASTGIHAVHLVAAVLVDEAFAFVPDVETKSFLLEVT